jgi:uncharacterized membrane protein
VELRDAVTLIVAILSVGGITGGLIALLKLRPEAGQIVVTAAEGALVIQAGVLEQLQAENQRILKDNQRILQENGRLRSRIVELENQVVQLRDEVRHPGGMP